MKKSITYDSIKPKILISKCIEHDSCRYDASMISSDFVKRIMAYVTFVTVCPEVAIGLEVPRESVRIISSKGEKSLVESLSGKDHTYKMDSFSDQYSANLSSKKIHGAILKSRSPSCGIKDVKIYPSIGRVTCLPDRSSGYFGGAVLEHNPNLAVEDEGRLKNYDIREHFLTQIFTIAHFDFMSEKLSINELVKFHSANKYLLMAYHQLKQKELGAIVANHSKERISVVLDKYRDNLQKALMEPMVKGKNTNMILHMFGYVSNSLSSDEKEFFLDELSLYNQSKKPLSVIMAILHGWVIRFDVEYLKIQRIFEPYPIEILDVMDSGKGIK
ncbi:MAG: DUF1722 domain-containing protein [Acidaminobacteraceae bacterium]